jgi:hypothetical protein
MGLFTQAKEAAKGAVRPRSASNVDEGAPEDTEADETSILCVLPPFPRPRRPIRLSPARCGRKTLTRASETRMRAPSSPTWSPSSGASDRSGGGAQAEGADGDGDDRVGMDLSKVSFPTFVLEPRSMLERITDFMAHPDLIFGSAPPFRTPSTLTRCLSVPSPSTTLRSGSFACFSTTSRGGTSSPRASRSRTTPYWASSSAAGTSTQTAPAVSTSPSKVRPYLHCRTTFLTVTWQYRTTRRYRPSSTPRPRTS